MSVLDQPTFREELLDAARRFVESAARIDGVLRIAIVGSLVTPKPRPKDTDLLVTISEAANIKALAKAGRSLKGGLQQKGSGADIFLCTPAGEYLGRTCSYRECHPRVACRGHQCTFKTWICDDLQEVCLDSELLLEPPVELWPAVVRRQQLPEDVERVLVTHFV
jgi:hypothetical protein